MPTSMTRSADWSAMCHAARRRRHHDRSRGPARRRRDCFSDQAGAAMRLGGVEVRDRIRVEAGVRSAPHKHVSNRVAAPRRRLPHRASGARPGQCFDDISLPADQAARRLSRGLCQGRRNRRTESAYANGRSCRPPRAPSFRRRAELRRQGGGSPPRRRQARPTASRDLVRRQARDGKRSPRLGRRHCCNATFPITRTRSPAQSHSCLAPSMRRPLLRRSDR